MKYQRANLLPYRALQTLSMAVSAFLFRARVRRNELKGKKGPYLVIANHECMLDFVNLIGLTRARMAFVVSRSMFYTIPVTRIMQGRGFLPKQQFQTSLSDMRAMKSVIEQGDPLVIYPAGLMCEDGVSTPIPRATYKFLKWLDTDVYMARSTGSYFVMPKWSAKMRPGRTYMDVYKLFDREELAAMPLDEVERRAEEALRFDAYREQEELRIRYKNGDDVRGLENVLYICPHCGAEFTMEAVGRSELRCTACGYGQKCDEFGFFHRTSEDGPELRYVSDWNRKILDTIRERVQAGEQPPVSARTKIQVIDEENYRFADAGEGVVTLSGTELSLCGTLKGEPFELRLPASNYPALPFGPGKYFEIQNGNDIYRCVLEDGKQVIRFIDLIKTCYALNGERKAMKRRRTDHGKE